LSKFDLFTTDLYKSKSDGGGGSMNEKEKEQFYGKVYHKIIDINSQSKPKVSSSINSIDDEKTDFHNINTGNRLRRKRTRIRKNRNVRGTLSSQEFTDRYTNKIVKHNKTLSSLNKRYAFSFNKIGMKELKIENIINNDDKGGKVTLTSKNDYYNIETRQREILSDNSMRRSSSGVRMKDPSIFTMLTSLSCFDLFDKKWIALMLSDNMFEKVFLHLNSLRTSSLYGLDDNYLSEIYFLECFGMRIEVISSDNQIKTSSNFLNENSEEFNKESKEIIEKINSSSIARFRAFFQNKTHKKVQDSLGVGGGNDDDNEKNVKDEVRKSKSDIIPLTGKDETISGKKINYSSESGFGHMSRSDVIRLSKSKNREFMLGNLKLRHQNNQEERKFNQKKEEYINNTFTRDKYFATIDQQKFYFGDDERGFQKEGFTGQTVMEKKVKEKFVSIMNDEIKWKKVCDQMNSVDSRNLNNMSGYSRMRDVEMNNILEIVGVDKNEKEKAKNENVNSSSSEEDDVVSEMFLQDMLNTERSISHSSTSNKRPIQKDELVSVYNSNIKSAIDALKTLSKECSLNVKSNNPDSSTTSASEIFGWMEENLCVDIFVYPGELNVHNDHRKLDFTFSLCGLDQTVSIDNSLKQ